MYCELLMSPACSTSQTPSPPGSCICAGQASPQHKAQQGKVILLRPLWSRGCCQAQTLFYSRPINLKERGTVPLFVTGSGSRLREAHLRAFPCVTSNALPDCFCFEVPSAVPQLRRGRSLANSRLRRSTQRRQRGSAPPLLSCQSQ